MGNNQLKLSGGLRLGNAAADLASPVAGLVYFNTNDSLLRLYDGSSWVSIAIATTEFNDNVFRIRDSADITKKLAFEAGNISASTTRTLTMPDADVNLGALTNSNISATAAIDYSKLNLTGSIVNADISASAAIARSKLASGSANRLVVNDASGLLSDAAAITAARALISDANGIPTHSNVTSTELDYVSGVTSAIQTQLNAKAADADVIKKDGSVAFTADQSMGGSKLTNLGAPSSNSDAATKQYVDNVALGLKPKQAVRVATTANLAALSGLLTVDGIDLDAGDRVLVKDQNDGEDNGIYVAASGAWARSDDFNDISPIDEINGAFVAVQEGTANAGKIFVQQGKVNTIGVDPIVFILFNASETLVGGNGITVSGNNISVDQDGEGLAFNIGGQLVLELDGSTLSKSASGLKVASGGITNTEVNASAAIAYSKLSLTNSVVDADIAAAAAIVYSKLSLTNSIVNADISATAAIDYSKLNLASSIVNADISASAAIAYSKLNLASSIVNADISASAAIAYSKLNLASSIVNADISASAAIAYSKLAALTADRALVSDASGVVSASSVSSTELGHLSGVTSAIQTQLDGKVSGPASATDEAVARFDLTTGKLIQNSNTNLNDSGSLTIADSLKRGDGNLTDFVEEEYIHNASLTASTTAVLSNLTFDSKVVKALQIDYMARNGDNRRTGKIMLVCDNAASVAAANVSIFDSSTETADIGLSWSAAINGDNVEVSYTTSSGTYSVNLDVKRLKA
jgi:hypothetical protein